MRVSSDLTVMSRAIKMLCAMMLQWRLRRDFVLRRRFRLVFFLRLCSDYSSLVLGLGRCRVVEAIDVCAVVVVWGLRMQFSLISRLLQ